MSRSLPDSAEELLSRYPLGDPAWPTSAAWSDEGELRDRFRGALIWGAAGDALGRPTEARGWEHIRELFPPDGVTGYHPWYGWKRGPIGTWTDDTQLTIEIAESLLANDGVIDPDDLARRFLGWLPRGRGKGRATTEAILAYEGGMPWWQAGASVDSAGNGAAMRAAPIGLVWALAPGPGPMLREAVLSALPTHAHRVGVAGAVAIAAGVAACVRAPGGEIDPGVILHFAAEAIEGLESRPTETRSRPPERHTLHDRILEVGELLAREPKVVADHLWSGAFALESVPMAFYCFLRSPDDPVEVLLTAANIGHDTDTIASMAGNMAGACAGAERLHSERDDLWRELEGREELIDLADGLLEIARTR